tara:strand:+ start:2994 stop:5096 length:2103 start_codon:yes stop_codon:yes gene_type:complete
MDKGVEDSPFIKLMTSCQSWDCSDYVLSNNLTKFNNLNENVDANINTNVDNIKDKNNVDNNHDIRKRKLNDFENVLSPSIISDQNNFLLDENILNNIINICRESCKGLKSNLGNTHDLLNNIIDAFIQLLKVDVKDDNSQQHWSQRCLQIAKALIALELWSMSDELVAQLIDVYLNRQEKDRTSALSGDAEAEKREQLLIPLGHIFSVALLAVIRSRTSIVSRIMLKTIERLILAIPGSTILFFISRMTLPCARVSWSPFSWLSSTYCKQMKYREVELYTKRLNEVSAICRELLQRLVRQVIPSSLLPSLLELQCNSNLVQSRVNVGICLTEAMVLLPTGARGSDERNVGQREHSSNRHEWLASIASGLRAQIRCLLRIEALICPIAMRVGEKKNGGGSGSGNDISLDILYADWKHIFVSELSRGIDEGKGKITSTNNYYDGLQGNQDSQGNQDNGQDEDAEFDRVTVTVATNRNSDVNGNNDSINSTTGVVLQFDLTEKGSTDTTSSTTATTSTNRSSNVVWGVEDLKLVNLIISSMRKTGSISTNRIVDSSAASLSNTVTASVSVLEQNTSQAMRAAVSFTVRHLLSSVRESLIDIHSQVGSIRNSNNRKVDVNTLYKTQQQIQAASAQLLLLLANYSQSQSSQQKTTPVSFSSSASSSSKSVDYTAALKENKVLAHSIIALCKGTPLVKRVETLIPK